MDRNVVFGEIVIDEVAKTRVQNHLFLQGRTDTKDHAADRLRPGCLGIQDTARGENAQHASQTDLTGIGIDTDLGEMGAIGLL